MVIITKFMWVSFTCPCVFLLETNCMNFKFASAHKVTMKDDS